MKCPIGLIVVTAIVVGIGASAQAALEPGLYGLQTDDGGIYKIDERTGEATLISTVPGRPSLTGVSFLDGELYATDYWVDPSQPGLFYGKIDVPTEAYTGIHDQGGDFNTHGLASSDTHGVTWAIGQRSGMNLIATDRDGNRTIIGYSGIDGRGMAYDDTHGILYSTNRATDLDRGLFTIDINTGVPTFIGDMGLECDIIGLAYDEDTQTLYANEGAPTHSLYTVDVRTGQATLVGANGFSNIDGLAWIPEPSTVILLVIGGVSALRRR